MTDELRIGLGTDLHRLVAGRPLLLGGVAIPSDRGALAHSDGDVVLHAISDALLGAYGGGAEEPGDIGQLFSDRDPRWAGLDSREIVRTVRQRIEGGGLRILNVDVVVDLQAPRLDPHRFAIRHSLADLLDLPIERVGFKAKTGEGLGSIGLGEAVACQAVVLLGLRVDPDPDPRTRSQPGVSSTP